MATARKFGKIDSHGKIVYAPSILRLPSGGVVMDPGEAELLAAQYMPFTEVIPPHDDGDIVQIDHYEVVNGEIVITYKVFDESGDIPASVVPEIAELNEQIAVLTSANTILTNRNEELSSANDNLTEEVGIKETQRQSLEETYYAEHDRVFQLETAIEEYRSRYIAEEELLNQVTFYREAAARAQYEQYEAGMEKTDSIVCFGKHPYQYESPYEDSPDDRESVAFYSSAHIVSKVQFVPLKIYPVTNGEETRYLVYTPPGRTFTMGNLPIPVEEAHGGSWVELQINNIKGNSDDSSSDSSDSEAYQTSGIITVYDWMDMEGKMHIGTSLPSEYVSYGILDTIDLSNEDSDSSASE